ncbi:MAG: Winged helix-turn-helix [Thermoproteota archaeon]|nr:Winged helix-turn-helix [Thermoproteota archaeon]
MYGDAHEILYEMLKIMEIGEVKTKVMFNSNLSYKQLTRYFDLLETRGLIKKEIVEGKEI